MDWDRGRRDRFDDHRGGESYRPAGSRGYIRRSRSPPRIRSPRLVADTWVPTTGRTYGRIRSRSPPFRRRSSRSPSFYNRDVGPSSYSKTYSSPRRFSPRRDVRPRSPGPLIRRPKSPHSEDRSRDVSWSQGTPKRPRDFSPSSRENGYLRRERPLPPTTDHYRKSRSPPRHGPSRDDDIRLSTNSRARSPLYRGQRERHQECFPGQKRRSSSPKGISSKRTSAPGSISNSRRSSPFPDKSNMTLVEASGRSLALNATQARCLSRDSDRSTGHDERPNTKSMRDQSKGRASSPTENHSFARTPLDDDPARQRNPEAPRKSPGQPNLAQPTGIPSQPKAYTTSSQLTKPGPPHGPKTLPSHPRASNISLLSAPTRPRGGSGLKESGWVATPARRGPVPIGSHGTPTGPRNTHMPTVPATDVHRQSPYRQNSTSGASSSPAQRFSSHLVGLQSITPGGKPLSSELDVVTDKRLTQLDADKDRLFEQIASCQRLKRCCIRDWDKLDRESSIYALKSELAEGHLQCITDTESAHSRSTF